MAERLFLHELSDFRDLIAQQSTVLGIAPQLLEKDYWIMHALWGLQQQNFKFELKGGTSLSKGFGIINRFSEDIDIRIEPPKHLHVMVGKNQDKPAQVKTRIGFYDWLATEISIPGIDNERDASFDDKNGRNAGIRLNYKSKFSKIEGMKDFVLLEVGFDLTTPNEKRLISSWLYDRAIKLGIELTDNRACDVACYLPGYTFVEKLDAISRKFQQEQLGKILPVNFIRHYYDVYQLLDNQSVLDFIGTKAYHDHKAIRFRKSEDIELKNNEAFILSRAETRRKYEQEYLRTKVLYYAGFPSFDLIIERIQSHLPRL